MTTASPDLRAIVVDCALERSPEQPEASLLADRSAEVLIAQGVSVDCVRVVDHDIAPGLHLDMTAHGWAFDEWPALQDAVLAADILVLATPTCLGAGSSVCTRVLERLYGFVSDHGPQAYDGRVAGCLASGDPGDVTDAVGPVLRALQRLGYTVPPATGAGSDPGVMAHLVRVARVLKAAG